MEEIFEGRKKESKLAVFCKGKQISNYQFETVKQIRDHFLAYNATSFTIFDSNGNKILSKKNVVETICDRIIIASKNGCKGVYSYNGKLLVPTEYSCIVPQEKVIEVQKDGLWGAYSYKGKFIVPTEFHYIECNTYGIEVEKNGLSGVYSYKGKLIVPVKFKGVTLNIEGFLAFKSDGSQELYSYDG